MFHLFMHNLVDNVITKFQIATHLSAEIPWQVLLAELPSRHDG